MTIALALAALLAAPAMAAEDAPSLIIAYQAAPPNRAAFRRELEDSGARQLQRWKDDGVLQAYLSALKDEIPMFAGDGRMPAGAAEHERRVLAELNPKYEQVKVEETYTNIFVDAALRGGDAR